MNRFCLLFLAFACSFCTNSNSSQQGTDAAAAQSTANETTDEAVIQNGIAQQITLYSEDMEARTGDNICLDVRARDFQKILSMQYTMIWREQVLKFVELKNLNLPFLTEQSFGAHRTEEGMLTFAWLDNSLKSVSVADGTSLYQVCFEVVGKLGDSSYFKITDRPTPIEVANLQEKVIPLKRENGTVSVK